MAIVRWSPIMRSLNAWPNIWEDNDLLTTTGNNNLDVYETEDEVVVKANVAGIPSEKVDVTFEKGTLLISAQKDDEESSQDKTHYSKSSWNYSYRVAVPGMIDYTKDPTAEVDNGVVTVTFKKTEASKPKKLTVTRK